MKEILYQPILSESNKIAHLVEEQQLFDILAAALSVGLFEKLVRPVSAEQLASENNWDIKTLCCLLDVLVKYGLTCRQGNKLYVNSSLAEGCMRKEGLLFQGHNLPCGSAGSFDAQIIQCLTKGSYYSESPEPDWTAERLRQIGVGGLSGSIQATVNACDLGQVSTLLDLGGGHGFYSIALAQKYPSLHVILFDLPQVVSLAESFVRRFHLTDRIDLMAGNFITDGIGARYDAVLCANILHSDKRDIVLSKVFAALNPGGQIIVKCRIDDAPENLSNSQTRLFWQVRGGKELFSKKEWYGFIQRHGFNRMRTVNIHGIFATIVGEKGTA